MFKEKVAPPVSGAETDSSPKLSRGSDSGQDPNGRENAFLVNFVNSSVHRKPFGSPLVPFPKKRKSVKHVEKAPQEFEINMLRCIYCGYCQEVCPEEAIYLLERIFVFGV